MILLYESFYINILNESFINDVINYLKLLFVYCNTYKIILLKNFYYIFH